MKRKKGSPPKAAARRSGPPRRHVVPGADFHSFFDETVQKILRELRTKPDRPPGFAIACYRCAEEWTRHRRPDRERAHDLFALLTDDRARGRFRRDALIRFGHCYDAAPEEMAALLARLTAFHATAPKDLPLDVKVAEVSRQRARPVPQAGPDGRPRPWREGPLLGVPALVKELRRRYGYQFGEDRLAVELSRRTTRRRATLKEWAAELEAWQGCRGAETLTLRAADL